MIYVTFIGKPAKLSSMYVLSSGIEHAASNAVDGVYDENNPDRFSLVSSHFEHRPWWRVDLVGTHCVWAVNILNRFDGSCCNTSHHCLRFYKINSPYNFCFKHVNRH